MKNLDVQSCMQFVGQLSKSDAQKKIYIGVPNLINALGLYLDRALHPPWFPAQSKEWSLLRVWDALEFVDEDEDSFATSFDATGAITAQDSTKLLQLCVLHSLLFLCFCFNTTITHVLARLFQPKMCIKGLYFLPLLNCSNQESCRAAKDH